jgi:hypothetical protein
MCPGELQARRKQATRCEINSPATGTPREGWHRRSGANWQSEGTTRGTKANLVGVRDERDDEVHIRHQGQQRQQPHHGLQKESAPEE